MYVHSLSNYFHSSPCMNHDYNCCHPFIILRCRSLQCHHPVLRLAAWKVRKSIRASLWRHASGPKKIACIYYVQSHDSFVLHTEWLSCYLWICSSMLDCVPCLPVVHSHPPVHSQGNPSDRATHLRWTPHHEGHSCRYPLIWCSYCMYCLLCVDIAPHLLLPILTCSLWSVWTHA